jgi:DNA-binding MarR family transcriptional regulator
VGDLIKPFSISGPAISRHLRVLENAKLIERKIDAQWRICKLNAPGLRAANDWLQHYREFWEQSLDRLVDVLESAEGLEPQGAARKPRRAPRGPLPKRQPSFKRRKSP